MPTCCSAAASVRIGDPRERVFPLRPTGKRVTHLLGAACCIALSIFALPPRAHGDAVSGEVFPLTQPDGSRLEVRIWGDEFYRVVETLDGYTLVHDPKQAGAFYARLSPDGNELVSTGVPATATLPPGLSLERHVRINPAAARARVAAGRARFAQIDREALAALPGGPQTDPQMRGGRGGVIPPTTGLVRAIVLLVDFSDDPATIPTSNVDDYCNLPGYTGYGNVGSVRDYFYDVSNGLLTYTNYVPTVYFRAPFSRAYYENITVPFGTRARQLMLEALNDLESRGFDFSQYDSTGDGRVDGLNMFYAGERGAVWAEGLWPHSSSISFSADGVSTYKYQMTNLGSSLALRTFCHENGHMICYWPDLYDYDYDSTGVGRFCLMCYGTSNTNPQEPCAYMKYTAGWSTPTLLTTPQLDLPLPSADSNAAYKFEHPWAENEYYMIENRQKSGRDSGLPDAGLAIWHIDTWGSNNNNEQTPSSHFRVTLVQADGDWDLENNRNYGDTTDLWKAPTYTDCTPDTNPNTDWWNGNASDLYVRNISASMPVMTFSFGEGLDCNNNGVADELDIAQGTSDDCNGTDIPDECDIATADSPDDNSNEIPDECELDFGPQIQWKPAGASAEVICTPGTGNCGDREIILARGGVTVTLFMEVLGWDTDQNGDPMLGAFQGTVDAATYLGGDASGEGTPAGFDLTPVGSATGMGAEGAFQAIKVCATVECAFDPNDPACTIGWFSKCGHVDDDPCPAEVPFCIDRPDYVFHVLENTAAVSTATQDYSWSAVSTECRVDPDSGATKFYGGTLLLEVPVGAKGTYNVGFIDDINFTLFDSCPGPRIRGLTTAPGQITIRSGRCCYGIDTPDEGCIDNITQDECDAMPAPQYAINPNATCAAECVPTAFPPALPPSPEHQTLKHRYLSIDSSTNAPTQVAYRVDLVSMKRCSGDLSRACMVNDDCEAAVPNSGVCTQHPDVGAAGPWWVQAPQDEPLGCLPGPCGPTDQFARVDAAAYFDVWNLSTLHIGDCEIIPVAEYEIRACLPPDGAVCSDPLTIGTIAQPFVSPDFRGNYGDTVGPVDAATEQFASPDGFTNVVDVSSYILTNQNYGTANKPQTHPTWVDLHGLGDGNPPQYILNVSDMGQIIKAFAGDAWTDDPGNMNPGQCP